MILIADSGATKTDWYISDIDHNFNTIGLHPLFVSEFEIFEALNESIILKHKDDIINVFFYGAGCGSEKGRGLIEKSLQSYFTNSEIEVYTDLLGAGRSLFGKQKGIAAIIGTGSNSALMDNAEVIHNHPSLGFILGDEGSGSYLGKKFLSSIFNEMISDDISKQFNKEYKLQLQDILPKVYSEKFPNRYLASFTKFLGDNIEKQEIYLLVKKGLEDFFNVNLKRYTDINNLPVRFTGSIAYYFSDILFEIGKENNIKIDIIEKQPINGLIKYHLG